MRGKRVKEGSKCKINTALPGENHKQQQQMQFLKPCSQKEQHFYRQELLCYCALPNANFAYNILWRTINYAHLFEKLQNNQNNISLKKNKQAKS